MPAKAESRAMHLKQDKKKWRQNEGETCDIQRSDKRLSEWQKEKQSEGAAAPLFILCLVITRMINDRHQEISKHEK